MSVDLLRQDRSVGSLALYDYGIRPACLSHEIEAYLKVAVFYKYQYQLICRQEVDNFGAYPVYPLGTLYFYQATVVHLEGKIFGFNINDTDKQIQLNVNHYYSDWIIRRL